MVIDLQVEEKVNVLEPCNKNKEDCNKSKEEFLKWNYEQCQTGYHSRDQMTIDIFYKMSQIFTFLIALLAVSFLTQLRGILIAYIIIVGIFGFLSLSSLLLHLQSMVSCKTALRWGCKSIEEELVKNYPGSEIPHHWELIDKRRRQGIEKKSLITYLVNFLARKKRELIKDLRKME